MMSPRSRRLAATSLLSRARTVPAVPRADVRGFVRRSLVIMLALGGLAVGAGPALAAHLRWSGVQKTDFVGNIALGSMTCLSSSSCQALDADGRLVQFDSDPSQQAPNDIANQDLRIALDPPAPLVALACARRDGRCTAVDRAGSVTTFTNPYGRFRFTRVVGGGRRAAGHRCGRSRSYRT